MAENPNFRWGMALGSTAGEGLHPRSDWAGYNKTRFPESYDGNGFATNYADDFKLVKSLGVTDVAITVDWSACEPWCDKIDRDTFDRYQDIISNANDLDLKVWLRLVDTTLPGWFGDDMGGFSNQEASRYYFIRQTERVADRFGDDVAGFTPINDPVGWALRSYGLGTRPPGHIGLRAAGSQISDLRAEKFYEAVEGALIADHLAARLLNQGRAQTMCIRQTPPVYALTDDQSSVSDRETVRAVRDFWDHLLFGSWIGMQTEGVLELALAPADSTKNRSKRQRHVDPEFSNDFDIIGIGYDHPIGVDISNRLRPYPHGGHRCDNGFVPVADQLGELLERLLSQLEAVGEDLDLVIASNGLSTTNDEWRSEILGQYLEIVDQFATSNKLNGFFADRAIDGYEAIKGFSTERGLIGRDRKPKESARVFQTAAGAATVREGSDVA